MSAMAHDRLRPPVRLSARMCAVLALFISLTVVLAGASNALASPARHRPSATAFARRVEVIVQLRHGVGEARGRELVRSVGGRAGVALPIIDGLSARVTAGATRRLTASPLIREVTPNSPIRTQDYFGNQGAPRPWALASSVDQSVGAPQEWRQSTGRGVGVAVIDTGIAGDLPDFQSRQGQSRVVASAVIDPNATTANDTYGHGTAVAGLIAGNGDRRDPGDPLWGQYAGTAPGANLISIKIADDSGQSTILDAIYGLQFAVDHQQQYNIRVINMSFRSTTAQSYTTDPLDAAAEQAWLHGIVVVAAAGNLGTAPDAVSYAPANDPYVLTVGAVDTQGTADNGDDVIPSWSSQGTTQDGFAKPDVLAPGAHIVTTLSPGSDFQTLCPTCVIGGAYFQVSGTSLAAPVVAGVAADLIADHPDWSPDQVKGAIVDSAVALPGGGTEVNAPAADSEWNPPVADQNLTPSTLIDPGTGDIDYSQASWSSASWSSATDPLSASWSSASWSCLDCTSSDAGGSGSGSGVDPTSASWSSLGWTTLWN